MQKRIYYDYANTLILDPSVNKYSKTLEKEAFQINF